MLVKHFETAVVNSADVVDRWKLQATAMGLVPLQSGLVVLGVWFACVDYFAAFVDALFRF